MYEMIIADVTVCVTQLIHNLHISFLANRQVLEIFNLIQDEGEGKWEGGRRLTFSRQLMQTQNKPL